MSTLELEHLKHTSSSSNNLSTHSDGSLTVGNLQSLNVLGDLTVDTSTLKVDATNNRVGIGTSSPGSKVHISGNSSTRNSIVNCLTLDGGTSVTNPYDGFGTGITFQGRDYGNAIRDYAYIRGQITNTTSNSGGGDAGLGTALTFWTTPTGGGGNTPLERMRINKDGHVTNPNQPYFYATGTATGTQISTAPCPYNQTSSNIGGHYNTSNYTFTAPIDGRYLFTVSALNYPSASSAGEMYFSVNGGGYTALMRFNGISQQVSITGSAILNLSANDTVKVIGSLYFYTSGGHGHFSGMLLG